mgnify:CR=1 FL=1
MREYDKLFPEYDFAKNKGYGTAEHVAARKDILDQRRFTEEVLYPIS